MKLGATGTVRPILCVDFDGVIHSYTSGWKGIAEIPDPPVPGALLWLAKAQEWEWFEIAIYSSRSLEREGIEAMQAWLRKHARAELEDDYAVSRFMDRLTFPTQKPAAFLTIDDRAICFDGDWGKLDPKELRSFKPWNQR